MRLCQTHPPNAPPGAGYNDYLPLLPQRRLLRDIDRVVDVQLVVRSEMHDLGEDVWILESLGRLIRVHDRAEHVIHVCGCHCCWSHICYGRSGEVSVLYCRDGLGM